MWGQYVDYSIKSHNQKVILHSFQSSWPKECNGAIDDPFGITEYECQHQLCHMTKKSCSTSFQSSWPNEYSGAIENTWHHVMPTLVPVGSMAKKVMLHLISVVLT